MNMDPFANSEMIVSQAVFYSMYFWCTVFLLIAHFFENKIITKNSIQKENYFKNIESGFNR